MNGVEPSSKTAAGEQSPVAFFSGMSDCFDCSPAGVRQSVRLKTSRGLPEQYGRKPIGPTALTTRRFVMKALSLALAAAASTLVMTAASAAPLAPDVSVVPQRDIQQVRMVCNEDGRCWRERRDRVIIHEDRDSYAYAPRERYIERRTYEDRGGIGIRAPGVSVGIGTDRY